MEPEPSSSAAANSSATPTVIAFINPKSGGGLGQKLLEKLQVILGDDHVFSLIPDGPEPGYANLSQRLVDARNCLCFLRTFWPKFSSFFERRLKKWRKTKNLRVIAGGGDGTVVRLMFRQMPL